MESPPIAVNPNFVTVPVIHPKDGNYTYVFVKGSLYARDSAVFGLSSDEVIALSKRFQNSSVAIDNGVLIKGSPSSVINTLAQLGYKIVSSTGDAEVVWTLQREI